MKLSHAASTTLPAIAELRGTLGVGSGALLGSGFGVCDNIIYGLQYLIVVVNIAFGNYCNQLLEPLAGVRSEITSYRLGIGEEAGNSIKENHRMMLITSTTGMWMQPVNLMPPCQHERQELALPIFGGTLGGGDSLQLLGMQTPPISQPSSSQPTSTSKPDGICVGHVVIYLLLLAVSAGFAWQIGYATPPNVES